MPNTRIGTTPIPTQISSIFEGSSRVLSRVACNSSLFGDRTTQTRWPHPEQRVEELVDRDVFELPLLRPTHGGALSEGYDNVLRSFHEDLGQTAWRSTSGGGITCTEGWPEQSRGSKPFQRAGEHGSLRTREELFVDSGRLSLMQVGAR